MSDLGNREVLSKNLRFLMERAGKDRSQICSDLNLKYTTVTDWYNGTKYPRIDKIELLANYFGVMKSDLIEDKGGAFPSLPPSPNLVPLGEMQKVPLVGQIACGTPILAEENIEDYVDLPRHIRADYALTCKGDSMINAGIHDGDVVYIRKQETVNNGQIAAVLVDEEEATLKRFYYDGKTVTLAAENPAVAPLTFTGEDINRQRVVGLAVAFTSIVK